MQDSTDKNRVVAYKILVFEAIFIVIISLLLVLGVSVVSAYSVLVGGLAFIIPNAYFIKYVFRYSAADSPRLALRGFYLGEAIKIIVTVLIFTFGFLFVEQLNVLALVLTYITMLIINLWGNSILLSNPPAKAGEMENKKNGD